MPMAGRGSRFAEVGFTAPKPLIDVRGKPMYAWAMDSLPLSLAHRVIFICLAEHLADRALEADIRERYAAFDPVIVPLDKVTEGQACTVLEARAWIDTGDPLIIYNADTYCRTLLAERLPTLPPSVAGLLSVFQAPGDKWSFARTDEHGRVVETAEKRRISDWATTGLYHFTRGRDFVKHAQAMIDANEREKNEFYVAPVYNRLIAAGLEIRLDVAEEVWVLGTPEDLADFEARYPR
jgi:UDP-N-acetylglucosamine diphosphorylase / glucose-1-phosphate thymidylyltransferase / UDP-N-acetylgalactosamine diphosphorylase / glucosamine-1-phosphate N-acetyltransferase / galactosamine-1-phosphate N-acetyltransferase